MAARVFDLRIGAEMRARRAALRLSQDAVAEQLGVSQAQMAKYESGTNQVPIDKVPALVEILQVDVSSLLGIGSNGLTPLALEIAHKFDALPASVKGEVGRYLAGLLDVIIAVRGSIT